MCSKMMTRPKHKQKYTKENYKKELYTHLFHTQFQVYYYNEYNGLPAQQCHINEEKITWKRYSASEYFWSVNLYSDILRTFKWLRRSSKWKTRLDVDDDENVVMFKSKEEGKNILCLFLPTVSPEKNKQTHSSLFFVYFLLLHVRRLALLLYYYTLLLFGYCCCFCVLLLLLLYGVLIQLAVVNECS